MTDAEANKKWMERFGGNNIVYWDETPPDLHTIIAALGTFAKERALIASIDVDEEVSVTIKGEYSAHATGIDLADCIKTVMLMYPEENNVDDSKTG